MRMRPSSVHLLPCAGRFLRRRRHRLLGATIELRCLCAVRLILSYVSFF